MGIKITQCWWWEACGGNLRALWRKCIWTSLLMCECISQFKQRVLWLRRCSQFHFPSVIIWYCKNPCTWGHSILSCHFWNIYLLIVLKTPCSEIPTQILQQLTRDQNDRYFTINNGSYPCWHSASHLISISYTVSY